MRAAFGIGIALIIGPAASAAEPEFGGLLSTLEMRGTIGISVGTDSNPDEVLDGEGSAFGRVDGEMHLRIGESGSTRLSVDADGAAVKYVDDGFDEDYRYGIEAEIEQPIADSATLSLGARRKHDATDDPPTSDDEVWAEAVVGAPLVSFEVRGSISEYHEEVDRSEIEADDLEVFDYRTYAGRLRSELGIGSTVSPVLEIHVARLDYLARRPGKPERDAVEYTAMAGAKWNLADDLSIQLGIRRNERFFDAAGVGSHANFGPDVEISWQPNDLASIELWLDRVFEEPSREEGLIRDVTRAGLEWTYRASDQLRLSGGAEAAKKREIGTDYRKTELEAYAEARFALRERIDLLFEALLAHEIRHDDSSSSFTRAVARTGMEVSF